MQYMLLIYGNEAALDDVPAAEGQAMMKEFGTFTQGIVASGHFRAGDQLQRVRSATTVRHKDGKPVLTDGPFAETREQLGGYYLIEARDLDEATTIAKRIPSLKYGGSIEVRPIVPMPPRG